MKNPLPAAALFAIVLSGPWTIAVAGSAEDQVTFAALESRWLGAVATHDTAVLSRILAPEFCDIAWNGRMRTRADMLTLAKGVNPAAGQQLSDLKVRRYGPVAIVTGKNTVTGMGPKPIVLSFTDVFVLRAKRWQAVSAQETLVAPEAR